MTISPKLLLSQINQQQRYAAQDHIYAWWDARETRVFNAIKRALDLLGASLIVVAVSPFCLLIAFLIVACDRGPVFFSQTRVGHNGKHFRLWKFRSMYTDAEARREAVMAEARARAAASGESVDLRFKMQQDPRITPIGKVLRRLSLDELPQILNILAGDMSLVGPRPPIPEEVDQYSFNDYKRLAVKPGLTCIWQVSGRSHIPFEQQVELDKQYIARQSLSLDLRLLYQTVGAVVTGRGAY